MATKTAGKPGKPGLKPEYQANAMAALAWLFERVDKNESALARALGRSQPGVSQLRSGKNKVSMETVALIASALKAYAEGESVTDIDVLTGSWLAKVQGDGDVTQLANRADLPSPPAVRLRPSKAPPPKARTKKR